MSYKMDANFFHDARDCAPRLGQNVRNRRRRRGGLASSIGFKFSVPFVHGPCNEPPDIRQILLRAPDGRIQAALIPLLVNARVVRLLLRVASFSTQSGNPVCRGSRGTGRSPHSRRTSLDQSGLRAQDAAMGGGGACSASQGKAARQLRRNGPLASRCECARGDRGLGDQSILRDVRQDRGARLTTRSILHDARDPLA